MDYTATGVGRHMQFDLTRVVTSARVMGSRGVNLLSPALATNIFWFLLLMSWLPLLASFENVIAQLDPFTWIDRGGARRIAAPHVVPFAIVSVLTLVAGFLGPLEAAGTGKQLGPRDRLKYYVVLIVSFLPSFLAALIAAVSQSPDNLIEANRLTGFYLAAVMATMLLFAWSAHLRSIYTGTFLLLIAIEGVTAQAFDSPTLTFGLLFQNYTLSIIDVVFFASVIVVARFVIEVVRQNYSVLREIWYEGFFGDACKAFLLWAPMLLVFLALNYFWNVVERQLDATLGALIVDGLPNAPPNPTLEDAIKFATDYSIREGARKTKDAVQMSNDKAQLTTAEIINSSLPAIRDSFPPYIMKPSSCRWYDIFCHVMNGIKSVVNSAYRKARDLALSQVEREARKAKDLVDKRGQAAVIAANQRIDATRQTVGTWTGQGTTKVFETATKVAFLLALYSLMMLIKTYLLVLARFIFRDDRAHPAAASLALGGRKTRHTTPEAFDLGEEFAIRGSRGKSYFIATSFEVRNAVPTLAIPQPFTSPISRLFAGRFAYGLLDADQLGTAEATIVVKSPEHLVRWELVEGQHLVVRHRDLVAVSVGDARFETELKLSVSALAFGRAIFHKIVGPGTVILRTAGEPVMGDTKDADESRNVSALKAWDRRARFQVQSGRSLRGLYFGSYNIRRLKGDNVLYDATPQTRGWRIGLASSVRYFLLPF